MLQESLDTIKRFCTKYHQTPTIQADFRASGDRLFDSGQQQKRLNHIRNCVHFISQAPHRKKHEKEPLQYPEKGTEVDARAAALYRTQGDTDIMQKESIFLHVCGVTDKTNSLKETTAQKMIRLSSLQWQIRTRGLTKASLSDKQRLSNRRASFLESTQPKFQRLCRQMGMKMQTIVSAEEKNKCTYETMEIFDEVASGPPKTHNTRPQQRQAQFGNLRIVVQTNADG